MGRGVAGRGFPFYFWPIAWGGAAGIGTAAYLHSDEVCVYTLYYSVLFWVKQWHTVRLSRQHDAPGGTNRSCCIPIIIH